MQYFRRKYNLLIGETTAEDVKIKIGSAVPQTEERTMEVKGRDQVTGLPKTIAISSEEVRQALSEPLKLIVDVVKATLEETPAELSADLVDRGIVLAGRQPPARRARADLERDRAPRSPGRRTPDLRRDGLRTLL